MTWTLVVAVMVQALWLAWLSWRLDALERGLELRDEAGLKRWRDENFEERIRDLENRDLENRDLENRDLERWVKGEDEL